MELPQERGLPVLLLAAHDFPLLAIRKIGRGVSSAFCLHHFRSSPNLPHGNAERNSVLADFMLPCLQAKATEERSEWTRSFVRMVKAP